VIIALMTPVQFLVRCGLTDHYPMMDRLLRLGWSNDRIYAWVDHITLN
jgi:hypothetical protein